MGSSQNKYQIRELSQYKLKWEQSKSINGALPKNQQQGGNEKDRFKMEERTKYPACCMVRIVSTINGKQTQGSGSLIANNVVITCAHNLFKWQNGIAFRAETVLTFVCNEQKQVLYFQYHPSHQETGKSSMYDYGIIVLKENLNYGYLGIIQNWQQKGEVLNMSFPVVTNGQSNKKKDLYYIKNGKILNSAEYFYQYCFPTSKGSSGSPIFVKTSQDNYQIIGIHIQFCPQKQRNYGLKFTREMKLWINLTASKTSLKQVYIKQQINNSIKDKSINHVIGQLQKQVSLLFISQLFIVDPKGQFKLQLETEGLEYLSHLVFQNLKLLHLTNNKIQMIPKMTNGFKNLIQLRISNNPIKKIQNLEAMPQIRTLYFNHNQISKIQNLTPLKKLKRLTIINNRVTAIENIEGLKKLQYLNLSENYIHQLKNLQVILGLRKKDKQYRNQIKVYLQGNSIRQGIIRQGINHARQEINRQAQQIITQLNLKNIRIFY